MESIKRITKGETTYALFCKGTIETDAVRFLTEATDAFQVGVMQREAGYEVRPHTHPPLERKLIETTEFLLIQSGRVRAKVFDDAWEAIAEEELAAGDFLIFFRGGHALTMLEPTRLIEVKQGPYPGAAAGKAFYPVS